MSDFAIVHKKIDIQAVIESVTNRNAGAICTFIGTVRELTKGKKTLFLEYQAYEEMAVQKLGQIGEQITSQYPNSCVSILHRVGRLEISDVAVVIAVSTPHRADSFAACRYAIEQIKQIVPIWKQENWEDGTSWIGDQRGKIAHSIQGPQLSKEVDA